MLINQRNREVINLYRKGIPIKDIANIYRCSYQNIYAMLKRNGVETVKQRKYTYDVVYPIGNEYENTDIPTKELADRYGISADRLRHIVREYGYTKKIRTNIHPNKRQVYQYDKQGNLVGIYDSIYQCGLDNNIEVSRICAVMNGRRKSCHGYVFRDKEFKK